MQKCKSIHHTNDKKSQQRIKKELTMAKVSTKENGEICQIFTENLKITHLSNTYTFDGKSHTKKQFTAVFN